jgi:8-oxo-dGDP phosphatase
MLDRATVAVVDEMSRVLVIARRLPSGYLDPEVDPAISAASLVEQMTGWQPRSVTPALGCDIGHVFLAWGAERTETEPTVVPEWIALDGVPDRLARGEFRDAASVIGLMAALLADGRMRTT